MKNNTIANIINALEEKSNLFWMLLIGFLTFFVYSDIFFGHQFLTYDDNWYIYENKNVINFSWESVVNIFTTPQGGQYSPIGEFYHSVIYNFFGKNAVAFKFFSLVIHIVNAILVFCLMRKLVENKWAPIFVALVFAIHPTQVETVAWISAIYRIAVLFMLIGYLWYVRYLEKGFKPLYLALTTLFFILGLFTKEQAILFPIGLVIINLHKGFKLLGKRSILENLFFGLLVLGFGLITLEITKTGGPDVVGNQATLLQKVFLLSDTFLGYVGNFLWPFELSFSYPYPKEMEAWTFADKGLKLVSFVILLVLPIIAAIKLRRSRFGIFWVFGFLSLALSFSFFTLRDTFMADRYTYFVIIGYAYLLYYVLDSLKERMGKYGFLAILLGLFFLYSLAYGTYTRVKVFKDSKTVWTNALRVNPKNPYAHNSLGFYYRTVEGDLEKAEDHYKEAIKYNNTYFLAHSNLGKVYFERKKYKEALKEINQTLRINPNYKKGYENRVAVNTKLNDPQAIVKDIDYLLSTEPDNPKFLIVRAKANFTLKAYENSAEDAQKVAQLNPKDDFAHYLTGHSQYLLKDYVASEENLSKAIALNGKNGSYYFFRSLSRLMQGKAMLAYEDVTDAKKNGHSVNEAYEKQLALLAKK